MKAILALPAVPAAPVEPERRIAEIFARERSRLRGFIRRRIADPGDVEDLVQDVFEELLAAMRSAVPVEQVGAWLFQVARNRIIDRFRRRRHAAGQVQYPSGADESGEPDIESLLPSADDGPEAAYARRVLIEELDAALDELPAEQREVFVAHEIEGRSFRELAAETGLSINTLLARKRYAVLALRRRLQAIYDQSRSAG